MFSKQSKGVHTQEVPACRIELAQFLIDEVQRLVEGFGDPTLGIYSGEIRSP